ncbi:MAG TPA: hypothetical protein VK995_01745, partial [Oceanipulchritudo sp.]|nr:hypothetical protein [Oceanipulchritudo sp.]
MGSDESFNCVWVHIHVMNLWRQSLERFKRGGGGVDPGRGLNNIGKLGCVRGPQDDPRTAFRQVLKSAGGMRIQQVSVTGVDFLHTGP